MKWRLFLITLTVLNLSEMQVASAGYDCVDRNGKPYWSEGLGCGDDAPARTNQENEAKARAIQGATTTIINTFQDSENRQLEEKARQQRVQRKREDYEAALRKERVTSEAESMSGSWRNRIVNGSPEKKSPTAIAGRSYDDNDQPKNECIELNEQKPGMPKGWKEIKNKCNFDISVILCNVTEKKDHCKSQSFGQRNLAALSSQSINPDVKKVYFFACRKPFLATNKRSRWTNGVLYSNCAKP